MPSKLAASQWTKADSEGVWRALTGIVDFGDRMDFVFLQLSDPEHESAWKSSLRTYCGAQGLPFHEPASGETFLEWVESQRREGLIMEAREGDQRRRSVYFGSLLKEPRERFVLARVNESRDRLVNALCGTLCLVGTGDFVRRVATGAPSIWAMRTRAFEIGGPPPDVSDMSNSKEVAGGLEALRPPAPPPSPLASPKADAPPPGPSTSELDLLLSAAPRDRDQAVELKKILPGTIEITTFATEQAALLGRARFIVPLLSPSYLESEAWTDLSRHLDTDSEGSLRSRLIPVFLSDTPVPEALRDMFPLRLRTATERARELPRLLRTLRGQPDAWTGRDALSLDEVPLDLSRPAAQELVLLLSQMYGDWEEAKHLARLSGVPLHGVNASQGPFAFWHDLLKTAAFQGKLRSLIERALQDTTVAAFHPRLRALTGL